MNNKQLMIYGANGYTGELIAREAVRRGLQPILAGRSEAKLRPLATELGLPLRCFSLNKPEFIAEQLRDVDVLIHAAGPFSATAAPMMEGCLLAKTHYTDITGEIDVFEHAQSLKGRAESQGIVICPGVGFDVIPTDCVAAKLKELLPDATDLALGFDSRSGLSPGTAKTSIEGMKLGGKVRENGRLKTVPLAYKSRRIDFGDGEKLGVTIPWGDVSTAYSSTGIPNIEVYIPLPPRMIKQMKLLNWVRPILGLSPIQNFLKAQVDKKIHGPSEATRAKQPTYVWGEARNAKGEVKTVRIKTANGYSLTVYGSLAVAEYLMTVSVSGGAYTPSRLIGPELVTTLPESESMQIS